MLKKLFAIVSILLMLMFISNYAFATNTVKNATNNVVNTAVNGAHNLTNDVKNGINNASGTVQNAINGTSNGINNMTNNDTRNYNTGTTNSNYTTGTTNSNYNATRTTGATPNTMGINATTWVILGVAGVIIVSLIWYYASQDVSKRRM